MRGDRPYFFSDPGVPDFGDPDDPGVPDFGDPDDPGVPDFGDPDDPGVPDFGDPDDPGVPDFGDPDDPGVPDFGDPDDPGVPDFGDPDDPGVPDFGDPDDPGVPDFGDPDDPYPPEIRRALGAPGGRRALRRLCRQLAARRCGKRRRRCSPGRARRRFPLEHSGRIVVRLSADLDLRRTDGARNLREAARSLKLHGLRRLLKQHHIASGVTGRLVQVEDEGPGCEDSNVNRRSTYELERQAAGSALPPLHPLSSYWWIDARKLRVPTEPLEGETWRNGWRPSYRQTVRRFVRQLNELPEVDLAYRELAASDPSPDDTYLRVQEYLDRAPVGIDARWVWRHTKGEGPDPAFMDLEQGWLDYRDSDGDPLPHEDLKLEVAGAIVAGDNRHGQGTYRGHHGSAVVAQVVGEHDNELGICGVSRGARVVRLASHWDGDEEIGGNVADAIRHAIDRLDPGDVLLLEVQRSYLPTEVDPADRDAIRLAVAHGIVVIEAAGNGNADLDLFVDEERERVLSRRHPEFRESGALMVAAARATRPHDRLSGKVGFGSNYGSRIDCFAHGNRVVTAGYGDMNDYVEADDVAEEVAAARAYSAHFGGTSAAAPIIAGAALLVQGVCERRSGRRLSPWELRRLLADRRNGTPQGRRVRGRIGVMPDLRRILRRRLGLVSDLYIRDRPEDQGGVPVVRRTECSPDIIVMPDGSSAPQPTVPNDGGLPPLTAGTAYSVFVRLHNRGARPAERADVRLFWSPVVTLPTPDLWREVPPPPPDEAVTVDEQPVWTTAFPFEASLSGHCCFVATAQDRRDESADGPVDGLPLPPDRWPYFDWRRYLAFRRRHHETVCCNVHRVEAGVAAELPFEVTGTPDRGRTFSFEIVRNVPRAVSLELDAQAALASQIAGRRLWGRSSSPGGPEQIRLTPPNQPRLLVEPVRLIAGARFGCTLRVAAGTRPGDSLAIRQLYRGYEVGRITWRFGAAE